MAKFLISYDLNKPEKDYPDLLTSLRAIGAKRVLYSEWMLNNTGNTAEQIFNHVRSAGRMDSNDGLLVVRVDDWIAVNTQVPVNTI